MFLFNLADFPVDPWCPCKSRVDLKFIIPSNLQANYFIFWEQYSFKVKFILYPLDSLIPNDDKMGAKKC